MKVEVKVEIVTQEIVQLSNRFVDLVIPRRSKLIKGIKLKEGDLFTLSLQKVKRKK